MNKMPLLRIVRLELLTLSSSSFHSANVWTFADICKLDCIISITTITYDRCPFFFLFLYFALSLSRCHFCRCARVIQNNIWKQFIRTDGTDEKLRIMSEGCWVGVEVRIKWFPYQSNKCDWVFWLIQKIRHWERDGDCIQIDHLIKNVQSHTHIHTLMRWY